MRQDPLDMFEELDELFDSLFSRTEREFFSNTFPGSGHRAIFADWKDTQETSAILPPVQRSIGKPVPEVHQIGDEVMVITELPGIPADRIRLKCNGNELIIDAGDADHHYHTTATLPAVDPASMRKSLKNGVLEVTFRNS
jgi:HSP20 family molecular chaperone IbpA